jgi:integrase
VCGLRVSDVDFMRGVVSPVQQYPADPLKTEMSRTPVPVPSSLALALSAYVAEFSSTWVMCDDAGQQMGPWQLQREFRKARENVQGLPAGFRFHDLRHYFASLLIASNLDVKTVQVRLRHASAKTTLDTYGHLWPDSDDSTRAAIDAVMAARAENLADFSRTRRGGGTQIS